MNVRTRLLLLSLLSGSLALFLALGPLQGVPHLNDELAYTVQARLFAVGKRLGPGLEGPGLLEYPFLVTWPKVYGVFPPGWPALLALGEMTGLSFALNPLIVMLLPVLSWLLAKEWLDEDRALLAAVVMACSPGVLLLAATRMPHTSVLAALMCAGVVILRGRDSARYWALAGLCLAYVTLARPFDGVVLGGPLALWGLSRARWRERLGLALPMALAGALVLLDNHVVTGDWLTFPASAWFDAQALAVGEDAGCNSLGFGPTHGCVPTHGSVGHTPEKALLTILQSAQLVDRLLLGLPGGGALALLGLAMAGRRWLSVGVLGLTICGYALYWSPGIAYGGRFWHPLYAVLPLGAAWTLHRVLGARALFVPLLLGPLGLSFVARELPDYWCIDGSMTRLLAEQGVSEGVVLMRGAGRRVAQWPSLGVPAFVCDPVLEQGELLLAWDPTDPRAGIQPRRAMPDASSAHTWSQTYHPDAEVYLLRYDVSTGAENLVRLTSDP